jgi:hypothetical protein
MRLIIFTWKHLTYHNHIKEDLVINISHSMDNMDKAVLNFEKDRDFCLFYIVG